VEGWLTYLSEQGALQATAMSSLEVHDATAGLWGFGTLSTQPARVSFNVTASRGQGGSRGAFRIVVYTAEGRPLLSEEGPVISGAVTVNSRDPARPQQ
jgi:hypothetical protein